MIRLVGKQKPKNPPPDITQAVQKVDDRSEGIEKKIATLELEMKKYIAQLARMRESPAKDNVKQKAIQVLNQKRNYQSQLETLRNQSFTMEQTNFLLESAKDTKTTLKIMKKEVESTKKELNRIKIDEIENLQDKMAELVEFHNDVQEVMGRNYRIPDISEDELQAELDALGDELALDEDSSYLDEVKSEIKTPGVPVIGPCCTPGGSIDPGRAPSENRNALVDEFGLPKLPSL